MNICEAFIDGVQNVMAYDRFISMKSINHFMAIKDVQLTTDVVSMRPDGIHIDFWIPSWLSEGYVSMLIKLFNDLLQTLRERGVYQKEKLFIGGAKGNYFLLSANEEDSDEDHPETPLEVFNRAATSPADGEDKYWYNLAFKLDRFIWDLDSTDVKKDESLSFDDLYGVYYARPK